MTTSFVGLVRRERDIGRFRLLETDYAPTTRIDWHAHGNPYLYLVLAGSFIEKLSRGSAERRPGRVTYRPPGESHATIIGRDGARCLMVEPMTDSASHAVLAVAPREGTLESQTSDIVACANRLVSEFDATDRASALAAESHILGLLAQLSRIAHGTDRGAQSWLAKVEAHLRETYVTPPDPATLSDLAGVSREHLSRAFRRQYGCTIGEFIRRLRLARAEYVLRSTDQPIVEVALGAGFCDQSHLTREFRRRNDMTPGAYRRLHRARRSFAYKNATSVQSPPT
jgi:AraC family transcriptional regulator